MKNIFAIIIFTLLPLTAISQRVIYEQEDSIRIEQILNNISGTNATTGGQIIAIANDFLGEKYVAATLEQGIEEPLFISCTKLDCTTFVELVLAIAKTANEGSCKFSDVCSNLEKIRYRDGKNSGYTSRLHYISWWIDDSAKEGLLCEITPAISHEKQPLNLNFMSTHPKSYPLLNENPEFVDKIKQLELPYQGIEVNYIPKSSLSRTDNENIKTGDIVAITTTIPGLDVTHIGFAHYHNGALCLLHASSGKGEVIKDTLPLRDYLEGKKNHSGIRVFRADF